MIASSLTGQTLKWNRLMLVFFMLQVLSPSKEVKLQSGPDTRQDEEQSRAEQSRAEQSRVILSVIC